MEGVGRQTEGTRHEKLHPWLTLLGGRQRPGRVVISTLLQAFMSNDVLQTPYLEVGRESAVRPMGGSLVKKQIPCLQVWALSRSQMRGGRTWLPPSPLGERAPKMATQPDQCPGWG